MMGHPLRTIGTVAYRKVTYERMVKTDANCWRHTDYTDHVNALVVAAKAVVECDSRHERRRLAMALEAFSELSMADIAQIELDLHA